MPLSIELKNNEEGEIVAMVDDKEMAHVGVAPIGALDNHRMLWGSDFLNKLNRAQMKELTGGKTPKHTDYEYGCQPDDLAHSCFRYYQPPQTGTFFPSACWLRGLLPILKGTVLLSDANYSHSRYRALPRMNKDEKVQMLRDFFFQNEGKKEYFAIHDWCYWVNPIHEAVKTNFAQAIPVLLVAGFIIDSVSLPNWPVTGLYLAVLLGKVESVEILLKAGAKANQKTKKNGLYRDVLADARSGETPFQLAERLSSKGKKQKKIFQLFQNEKKQ